MSEPARLSLQGRACHHRGADYHRQALVLGIPRGASVCAASCGAADAPRFWLVRWPLTAARRVVQEPNRGFSQPAGAPRQEPLCGDGKGPRTSALCLCFLAHIHWQRRGACCCRRDLRFSQRCVRWQALTPRLVSTSSTCTEVPKPDFALIHQQAMAAVREMLEVAEWAPRYTSKSGVEIATHASPSSDVHMLRSTVLVPLPVDRVHAHYKARALAERFTHVVCRTRCA